VEEEIMHGREGIMKGYFRFKIWIMEEFG